MTPPLDRLILAISLLLLGGVGVAVSLLHPTPDQIVGLSAAPKTGMVQPMKDAELQKIAQKWNHRVEWNPPSLSIDQPHPLFTGRPLLYFPDTGKLVPITGNVLIENKFPLEWLNANQIDYGQPGWRLMDPDLDGFSNEQEFDAGTNPRDPASHPPYITRLRLKKYLFKPFRIRFQAINLLEGEEVYQINLKDVAARKSRFVKKGDEVEGFVVGEYRKKIVTRMNPKTSAEETVDVSELDLYNSVIDYKVTLILTTDVDSRDSSAEFVMLLPGESAKPFEIKRGKTQTIKGIEYLLKDVNETEAILIKKDSQETVTVPLLKDGELDTVPVWPSSGDSK